MCTLHLYPWGWATRLLPPPPTEAPPSLTHALPLPRHTALLAILACLDQHRLKPEDRDTLLAVLDGYLLPSGRRWVDAAAAG